MAIPPDPIDEVLPLAVLVVEAEVKEVVSSGPQPPRVEAAPGKTSVPDQVRAQVVKLTVQRVLHGDRKLKELTVEKPLGAYALRPGNKGPFLIDGSTPTPRILGRYGPDTYSVSQIEAALKSLRKK